MRSFRRSTAVLALPMLLLVGCGTVTGSAVPAVSGASGSASASDGADAPQITTPAEPGEEPTDTDHRPLTTNHPVAMRHRGRREKGRGSFPR